jgi:hypothetical protein
MVALYQNRETAVDHFQTAVAMAPTSARAEPSLFWLQLLKETASGTAEDGRFSRATVHLVRDLLDRELLAEQLLQELEASPVQTLQRDLKARDKKLEDLTKELEASPVQTLQRDLKARDKKLEDLTKQLEALKQIDQEMREKTKTIPSRGKENP